MYALLLYSLKTGACLAAFYLFFKLLLSRETLHRFNRIVVLAGMVLAFALPLCVVTVYRELPQMPEIMVAERSELPILPPEEEAAFDWESLLGALFEAGAMGMLLRTLSSLAGVLRLIRSGKHERLDDGSVLVRVEEPLTPFSWGRYVVVSEEDMALGGREILLHEQAHLHLHHSVDLLVTDVAGCLQWFNPAMWLLRRELRAIHEYEADRAVIESGVEARDYQLLLIKKAVGGRWYSVANSFNHSKLKNRITMMLRKKSSRWTGAKALFVLPLAAVAAGAFAETVYVVPDDKVTKDSVTVDVSEPNISLDSLDGEPLMLVDGQEVASLDNIDPERIASIDVYKKGSETAETYGAKGRNGVVVVTLKKSAPSTASAAKATDTGSRKITIVGSAAKDKVYYIVDGAAVDNIDKLQLDAIKNVTVIKSDIPEEYKKQGYDDMVVITTKNGSAASYFQSDEWKAVQKQIAEASAYFESNEWKNAQKQIAEAQSQAYFKSDEWKAAQKQMAEAKKQMAEAKKRMAEAEKELNRQTVSIHADRYKEQQDESGVTHATGRITVTGTAGISDDCLIFINGKRSTKARMAKIPAGRIRSMNIYKGKQAVEKFGPEAAAGAIEIKTRKR